MSSLYGVVSLLDHPTDQNVMTLWRELEEECGLLGNKIMPVPHFSWNIALNYAFEELGNALQEIAAGARPFIVRTAGLGIFSGSKPVIYLNMVKDASLLRFREVVWYHTIDYGVEVNPLYGPDQWMPHITLVYDEVDGDTLNCLIQRLAFRPFKWEFRVDNLALIGQDKGKTVDKDAFYYKFSG